MCFSATASFTTAALLAPIGLHAIARARWQPAKPALPLAITPLLFAIQQALEGGVWMVLNGDWPSAWLRTLALGYLGFAFALWPIWMPWAALRLVAELLADWRQRLLRRFVALGSMLAMVLWLPLLLDPGRVNPMVRNGSIDYQAVAAGTPPWAPLPATVLYATVVCLPLLIHPRRRLQWLGVSLVLAFAVAQLAFQHAFSSVWCYLSAVLSLQVLWVVAETTGSGKGWMRDGSAATSQAANAATGD
ncbi:MAG: DUF6629 family protein [Cyanobium sp.]